MIDKAVFTPSVGLSEVDDMNEIIYWIKKNKRAITTPSLALVKNVCIKKLCMIMTMSNKIKTIKGTINFTRGRVAEIIALPIRWITKHVTKYLMNQVT